MLIDLIPIIPLIVFIIFAHVKSKNEYRKVVKKGYKGSYTDYIRTPKCYHTLSLGHIDFKKQRLYNPVDVEEIHEANEI